MSALMVFMSSISTRFTFSSTRPIPNGIWPEGMNFLQASRLAMLRYDGYGARSFFDELVCAMRTAACDSSPIIEALGAFVGEEIKPRDISKSSYKFDEARLGL